MAGRLTLLTNGLAPKMDDVFSIVQWNVQSEFVFCKWCESLIYVLDFGSFIEESLCTQPPVFRGT